MINFHSGVMETQIRILSAIIIILSIRVPIYLTMGLKKNNLKK
jgi:hypothetical protein